MMPFEITENLMNIIKRNEDDIPSLAAGNITPYFCVASSPSYIIIPEIVQVSSNENAVRTFAIYTCCQVSVD